MRKCQNQQMSTKSYLEGSKKMKRNGRLKNVSGNKRL